MQDWICQIEGEAESCKIENKKQSEQIDSQNSYIQTLIDSLKDEKDERAKHEVLVEEFRKKVETLSDQLKTAQINEKNLDDS